MARVDVPTLFRLWHDDTLTNTDIASALGVAASMLWHLKHRYKLPNRGVDRTTSTRRVDDPDEETIARRAAEIRARWSPEEMERRLTGRLSRVETPLYVFDGRQCAFAGAESL